MVCRPTIQTTMKVINPEGEINNPTSIGGTIGWEQIAPTSKVSYTITTYPERDTSVPISQRTPKSDKVRFEVWRQNFEYTVRVRNMVFDEATDDEQTVYAQELVAVMNGTATEMPNYNSAIEARTDPQRILTRVHSKSITTNSNGVASGEYQIPKGAKWGQYAFTFNYGYNHDADKSETDRIKEIQKQIFKGTVVAVLAVLTLAVLIEVAFLALAGVSVGNLALSSALIAKVGTALGAGAAIATGVAVFAIDWVLTDWILTQWGGIEALVSLATGYSASQATVGTNKYGCTFIGDSGTQPSPFIQSYVGVIAPFPYLDANGNLKFTNMEPDYDAQTGQAIPKSDNQERLVIAGGIIGLTTLYSLLRRA
tara:strand:- start:1900 stop:3003 length:1104 start_codon:yes stop_codon:yes gene_type:complete